MQNIEQRATVVDELFDGVDGMYGVDVDAA